MLASISTQLFQFHKGTIKTVYQVAGVIFYRAFQFHKGTIKTSLSRLIGIIIPLFQFHKGTIKTVGDYGAYITPHGGFNSIKVRLKRRYPTILLPSHILFQFHKGTIKTQISTMLYISCITFQFHKGTIKTPNTSNEFS